MLSGVFSYFVDPVLRGPTVGCMLMCLSSAIMGVIVFLRRQSLLGEALSHSTLPGVMLGVVLAGLFQVDDIDSLGLLTLVVIGAYISAWIGLLTINMLINNLKIQADASLCFVLAAFFGIGITLASQLQFVFSRFYVQSLTFLYGQAATLTDRHVFLYALLTLIVIFIVFLFFKEIQIITFDREYAKSLGIPSRKVDIIVTSLIVLSIVIGIRSVGLVLMSSMLIAPAVSARQFTNHFSRMMWIAALFGSLSGFLGNYLSNELSIYYTVKYPGSGIMFPTGPMIVLVATCFSILSLLFSAERGLLSRVVRVAFFRYQCLQENVLKWIWRNGRNKKLGLSEIAEMQHTLKLYLRFVLLQLIKNGHLIKTDDGKYQLTEEGEKRGAHIVRLHRIWEVYLVEYLGIGAERVHKSAEEMEHILTPEIEKELTFILNDPKEDPHHQPIPPGESG